MKNIPLYVFETDMLNYTKLIKRLNTKQPTLIIMAL